MDLARAAFGASAAVVLVVASLTVPEFVVDYVFGSPTPRAVRVRPLNTAPGAAYARPHPTRPSLVPPEGTPQRLDLRGNEIARPVARYRIDGSGSLYEVHSPNTELPRLKPPQL